MSQGGRGRVELKHLKELVSPGGPESSLSELRRQIGCRRVKAFRACAAALSGIVSQILEVGQNALLS
jgi:hypothetical protein